MQVFPFPLPLWALVVLLLAHPSRTEIATQRWVGIPVNVTQVTEGPHTELTGITKVACAGVVLATQVDGVYCYGGDRCVIARHDLAHVRGPATDGWRCYKAGESSCTLLDGSPLALYEKTNITSGNCQFDQVTCTIVGKSVVPNPLACLYVLNVAMSWEDARVYCNGIGAQLFDSHNSTQTHDLVQYLAATCGSKRYWLSLTRLNGTWRWGEGLGRVMETSEFENGWPYNKAAWGCVFVNGYTGLRDFGCGTQAYPVCQLSRVRNEGCIITPSNPVYIE